MSFDDYANHIYQKHRLAVALAILNSKPADINTENYIKKLKSKIEEKMDDDDITICSDDFVMDDDDEFDDSVNILKDFDPAFIDDETLVEGNMQIEPENPSQITYYDSQTENISEPLNISISQDNEKPHQKNLEFQPKLTISKESNYKTRIIDQNKAKDNQSYSRIDFKIIVDKETKELNYKTNIVNENMDTTQYDSQKTIIYTVPRFTQDFTHYSPSQDNIIIPRKYIHNVDKNKNVINKGIVEENGNIAAKDALEIENHFGRKENSDNSKNRDDFECTPTMNMAFQNNDDNVNEIQIDNSHFDDKNKRCNNDLDVIVNCDREGNNIQNSNRNSQNIDEYFDGIRVINDNDTRNSGFEENNMNLEVMSDMEQIGNDSFSYNQNISQNIENHNTNKTFEKAIDMTKVNNENHSQNDENLHQSSENSHQIISKPSITDSSNENITRREEFTIPEVEYETEEIISYKVLEEFNKVKSFLNRQKRGMSSDGYSSDSGYRSDSQGRSSNRSALQLSGNWLNQSGCCLFNYIMDCPLITSTRDITNEIAQILSQLIDKLHEEEQYPSFLEDILDSVKVLLRETYDGISSEESEFLKKDENIQRLLLLNKSVHIQKHSIEIITNILENFHTKITEKDSIYELTNIDEIENLAYILHTLEILLKKYMKNQELLSQKSTQNSQDDEKILKKSSITDIWRKKWNPKQEHFEGSREKRCVLKTCSEILNKIVVDCVSGYSLVAYSALKCFNSMQS